MVGLRARNRLVILAAGAGSLAVFPPPHKFFFARENEVNLGFVYYRKDNNNSFSLGVYWPEEEKAIIPGALPTRSGREGSAHPGTNGTTTPSTMRRPGSLQRMAVYYYLSSKGAIPTQEAVLAYTHNDVFKPLPGFKVMAGHFHLDFNEQLRERNTLDYQPPWVGVFRALGVNILYLGDFHDDSHPDDPGPAAFQGREGLFRGCAARLRQRLFGHAGGRAERRTSAATGG